MGVLDPLLPVFLMIGLGAALTRTGFLTADARRHLTAIAYWIGMPGLLFAKVCEAGISGARPLRISAVIVGATCVALAAAYPLARMLRVPAAAVGTFVQSGFRGNLTFVGLPLLLFAFDRPGSPAAAGEMAGIIALGMAPPMIFYAVLAVAVLLASHHALSRESLRAFVRQVVVNPIVLAVAAGLVASLLGIRLPRFLSVTIDEIGGLAIPAALLGVGGTLATAPLRAHLRAAVGAAAIKVAVVPLTGLALARALGLPPADAAVAVVLCATPTAAASFVMAAQLRGDAGLASSSIMLSTLCSAGSLALALTLIPAVA